MSAGIPEDLHPKVSVQDEFTPALYNDPNLTDRLVPALSATIGGENLRPVPPVMGGEDFGMYGRTEPAVPIQLFWLGVVAPEKVDAAARGELQLPSLHSSKYAPVPEPSIKTGVNVMSTAVLELLEK